MCCFMLCTVGVLGAVCMCASSNPGQLRQGHCWARLNPFSPAALAADVCLVIGGCFSVHTNTSQLKGCGIVLVSWPSSRWVDICCGALCATLGAAVFFFLLSARTTRTEARGLVDRSLCCVGTAAWLHNVAPMAGITSWLGLKVHRAVFDWVSIDIQRHMIWH